MPSGWPNQVAMGSAPVLTICRPFTTSREVKMRVVRGRGMLQCYPSAVLPVPDSHRPHDERNGNACEHVSCECFGQAGHVACQFSCVGVSMCRLPDKWSGAGPGEAVVARPGGARACGLCVHLVRPSDRAAGCSEVRHDATRSLPALSGCLHCGQEPWSVPLQSTGRHCVNMAMPYPGSGHRVVDTGTDYVAGVVSCSCR